MANLPREYADEAGKARSAGGGVYINHGDYFLMFKKCTFQKVQDSCVINEFFTAQARKKIVMEGDKKIEEDPNPVGSDCSYVINYDGPGKQSAHANLRGLALGLFGFTEGKVEDKVASATCNDIVGDNSPALGMLIGLKTYPKEVRSRKGEYITGMEWFCVAKPGEGLNAPALVAARLAAIKISPEECTKVFLEQMKSTGATLPELASGAQPALPPALQSVPAVPPVQPPPAIPAVTAPPLPPKDPLVGWTQHPENPDYVYQGSVVKTKAEVIAATAR